MLSKAPTHCSFNTVLFLRMAVWCMTTLAQRKIEGTSMAQAGDLREAGLTAYNHNLDTSPEYYSKITSSRKYEARALPACRPLSH